MDESYCYTPPYPLRQARPRPGGQARGTAARPAGIRACRARRELVAALDPGCQAAPSYSRFFVFLPYRYTFFLLVYSLFLSFSTSFLIYYLSWAKRAEGLPISHSYHIKLDIQRNRQV